MSDDDVLGVEASSDNRLLAVSLLDYTKSLSLTTQGQYIAMISRTINTAKTTGYIFYSYMSVSDR